MTRKTDSLLFDDFIHQEIKTEETTINLVRRGSGYPVLMLHGYPETHICWHRVAPILADRFTIVCPDLRGCGDSSKPESDSEHVTYSKRVMPQDQVEVMQCLGFSEFAVVGHDRGAPLDCGHFLPEEDPERTSAELIRFLS